MATTESVILGKISGHIARQLVFKRYGEKIVVTKYPDMSRRKLSPRQKLLNGLMAEANNAAGRVLADEKQSMAAQARLNVTRNKLYRALISEYLKNNAPAKSPVSTRTNRKWKR